MMLTNKVNIIKIVVIVTMVLSVTIVATTAIMKDHEHCTVKTIITIQDNHLQFTVFLMVLVLTIIKVCSIFVSGRAEFTERVKGGPIQPVLAEGRLVLPHRGLRGRWGTMSRPPPSPELGLWSTRAWEQRNAPYWVGGRAILC